MANIKDIYCMDITSIDAEIIKYKEEKKLLAIDDFGNFNMLSYKIGVLINLKSKLKPITPLLEHSWKDGRAAKDNFSIIPYMGTKEFEI